MQQIRQVETIQVLCEHTEDFFLKHDCTLTQQTQRFSVHYFITGFWCSLFLNRLNHLASVKHFQAFVIFLPKIIFL